jgi:hypothetical protein
MLHCEISLDGTIKAQNFPWPCLPQSQWHAAPAPPLPLLLRGPLFPPVPLPLQQCTASSVQWRGNVRPSRPAIAVTIRIHHDGTTSIDHDIHLYPLAMPLAPRRRRTLSGIPDAMVCNYLALPSMTHLPAQGNCRPESDLQKSTDETQRVRCQRYYRVDIINSQQSRAAVDVTLSHGAFPRRVRAWTTGPRIKEEASVVVLLPHGVRPESFNKIS